MVSKIAHKQIYPGIDFSKVQGGMLTFDEIPGLKEAGWDQEDYNKTLPEDMNLEDQCNFILNKLKQHQSAWPFKEPVNREEVKDYYDVIKEPMDLSTIESKINGKKYKSFDEFQKDVLQIFINC
jgi:histone acetyltransferase